MALVPSCQELSRAAPGAFPGSSQPPPCSLHRSCLGSEGCVRAGKAACDVEVQTLPCSGAGTALLSPHPSRSPSKCAGTPLPQGCPPLPLTPGLDQLVLSLGTFLWCTWACSLGRSPGEGATCRAAAAIPQSHPAGGWGGPILHPNSPVPPCPAAGQPVSQPWP